MEAREQFDLGPYCLQYKLSKKFSEFFLNFITRAYHGVTCCVITLRLHTGDKPYITKCENNKDSFK